MNTRTKTILIGSGIGIAALFTLAGFVFWTIIPQLQGREYLKKAAVAYTPAVITEDTFIFEPMTADQGLIRYLLVSALIQKFNEGSLVQSDPLFDFAVSKLEEYVARFPYYYEQHILLGKAYELQAILKKDPSFSIKAEGEYKKALALAPGRQDASYALAFDLLSQGRATETLTLLREMAKAQPELADTEYQIAQVLMVLGREQYDAALDHFETALSRGANVNPTMTLQMYQKLFYQYYHAGDFVRVRTTVARLATLDKDQAAQYEKVLTYMDTKHAIPRIDIQEPTR